MWVRLWLCVVLFTVAIASQDVPSFGKEMRKEFLFTPNLVFLNHGSFGATPRKILYQEFDYQIQMERNTMNWMNRERVPLLNECRKQIAEYSGSKTEDITMVLDATSAINAVFRSLLFKEGDKILFLDTVYGAVDEMFRVIQWAHNVQLIKVPVPFPLTSPQQITDIVAEQFEIHSNIRVALFSHITSPTAMILPVKELTNIAHSHGAQVFIDGAHTLGQIPVNITDIGADYYTADIHKWLCGPKGAGILWVRDVYHRSVVPTSISSGASDGYIPAFEWTGTLDFSAYLSTMNALSWRNEIGGDAVVNGYMTQLCEWAGVSVSAVWGTTYPAIAPQEMFASMSVAELPAVVGSMNLYDLQQALYDEYEIEVVLFSLGEKQYTRMSCHVYNYEEEYLLFAEGLLNITTSSALQTADDSTSIVLKDNQLRALSTLEEIRRTLIR